jgi:2,3-bisphosphoglycerate-dependent phosphoglycerate mutase
MPTINTSTATASTFGKLIIARHHESEWNKLGLWTGSRDIGLSPYGFEMAEKMGMLLNEYLVDKKINRIDRVFISTQKRTLETYESMVKGMTATDADVQAISLPTVPPDRSVALNERDYGDFTGKNKWEEKKNMGDAAFESLRRGWDTPVPHGETLKMVYDRTVPYFLETILPLIKGEKKKDIIAREKKYVAHENVLIVSSGNAIRALIKYIERIPDDKIGDVEMPFGGMVIYDLDTNGHAIGKEMLEVKSEVNA